MNHGVQPIELIPVSPAAWSAFPSTEDIRRQIALTVLSHSELTETSVGLYSPPKRIRNVVISMAAMDQITCMWHGHRKADASSPPAIPLKYFVTGFGQVPPDSWADVETHP